MECLEINIADFNKGDHKTFEEVFLYYYKPLQYFAQEILHHEEDSRDIVKSIFLKLWNLRENFLTPEKIKAFLFIAVSNACRNRLRDVKVRNEAKGAIVKFEQDRLDNNLVNKMIFTELLKNIYSEIEKLPPKRKQIFKLTYLEGLTNKEIAQKLKISVFTVKEHKCKALHRLRNIFATYQLT